MPQKRILGLLVWLGVTFATAAVGAAASIQAKSFYAGLVRPDWAPPAWLFGPVWTGLYLLMGIAAWLVWRERGFLAAALPLGLFLTQLVANGLWSWLFFVWKLGALAFAEVLMLWLLIAGMVVAFRRVSPLAAGLLLPYLAWVTFASALTYSVWQRNPQVLG
jgi:tryptophan-rich sensory protein